MTGCLTASLNCARGGAKSAIFDCLVLSCTDSTNNQFMPQNEHRIYTSTINTPHFAVWGGVLSNQNFTFRSLQLLTIELSAGQTPLFRLLIGPFWGFSPPPAVKLLIGFWHSNSSERGTKHVFHVNMSQISSVLPEISAENPVFLSVVALTFDLWSLTLTFKLVQASSLWIWCKSVQQQPRYFIHKQKIHRQRQKQNSICVR